MLSKNRFGSLSVPICNIFEDMIMDTPTAKADNSVLEDIKTEIESINDWAIRYAPTEDKDKREQVVAKVKKHIISIIDKHISG